MITRKRKANLETQHCRLQQVQNNHRTIDESAPDLSSSQCSNKSSMSQNSLPFNASSWKEVRKKLKSIAWIQCDNPDCRKWRKMPKEEIEEIGESDKWFCRENPDPDFNSCGVDEEDVEMYDHWADKSGLKYLKSQLMPGDLVWAKMDGYCRWPAVVSGEPWTEAGHVSRYVDGEIAFYHVEFLGQPHTHGWVCAKNIKVFTAKSVSKQQVSSTCQQSSRGRKRKGIGRKPLCLPAAQKLKTKYNGVGVDRGVQEALTLLPVSPGERLDRCTYVVKGPLGIMQSEKTDDPGKPGAHVAVSKLGTFEDCTNLADVRDKRDHPLSQFTSFDTCLEDRTKEERLMLDVEMYKRNERAFVHDVTRFMARSSLKPSKGPFWQNTTVSLFQLFLAVHERGGYTQVTLRKKWAAVYREVTETPCYQDVKHSSSTKLFYYRHLYPYELYVHGRDYSSVVSILKEEMPGRRLDTDTGGTNTADHSGQCSKPRAKKRGRPRKNKQETAASEGKDVEEDEDISSDSLREMLQTLENTSKIDLEGNINITFYDDSTPSKKELLPLTHFEPQGPRLPGHKTEQNMPDGGAVISMSSSSSNNHRTVLLKNVKQSPSPHIKPCAESELALQVVPSANDDGRGEDDNIDDKRGDAGNDNINDKMYDCCEGNDENENDKRGDNKLGDKDAASVVSLQLLEELDVLQDAMNFIDDQML